ncbi:MAG: hypothetical protein K0S32_2785 [Bacteroidetes bacterium]|jgi:hypothetical protein|nr:hypothetical protein [Bacteroidota bacterium]
MNKIIDEISIDRIEKSRKFLFYGAIVTAIIAVLKIFMNPEILTGGGKLADYLISLLPIYLYFSFRKKTSSRKGQFIKWTENSVVFKSRGSENQILLTDIHNIKITLDNIDLHLKDGSTKTINIEDYSDYDDRMRIKGNFEKLTTRLNS